MYISDNEIRNLAKQVAHLEQTVEHMVKLLSNDPTQGFKEDWQGLHEELFEWRMDALGLLEGEQDG